MKNIIYIILLFLVSFLLGFYGVFASVFSDGGMSERLITIAIILLIYVLLGFLSAVLFKKKSMKLGALISLPGILFLLLYLFREYNLYYIIYIILIFGFSYLGNWIDELYII